MEKFGKINPAAGDQESARSNMMDAWRESIERTRQSRQTAPMVAKDEAEARSELEQRIRNGQAPCPTCAARTYKDDSDDSGVSFQAPKHIAASVSGITVMSHEMEHANHEHKDANEEKGEKKDSTMTLQWAKCPECGRTYVKGGVTKTTTRIADIGDKDKNRNMFGGFEAEA